MRVAKICVLALADRRRDGGPDGVLEYVAGAAGVASVARAGGGKGCRRSVCSQERPGVYSSCSTSGRSFAATRTGGSDRSLRICANSPSSRSCSAKPSRGGDATQCTRCRTLIYQTDRTYAVLAGGDKLAFGDARVAIARRCPASSSWPGNAATPPTFWVSTTRTGRCSAIRSTIATSISAGDRMAGLPIRLVCHVVKNCPLLERSGLAAVRVRRSRPRLDQSPMVRHGDGLQGEMLDILSIACTEQFRDVPRPLAPLSVRL